MLKLFSLRLVLYFSIVYILILSTILSFSLSVKDEYDSAILLKQDKLSGLEYIVTLHDFTYQLMAFKDKDQAITTIDKLYTLQIKYPIFKDKIFNKDLQLIQQVNEDYYEFLESLNNQNYLIAEKSGLILSDNKQNYFLASLSTHYISELLISSGLSYSILHKDSNTSHITSSQMDTYLQQRKLIDLSISESATIIGLTNADDEITQKFILIQNISAKLYKTDIASINTEIANLKELFDKSYALIKLISNEAKSSILNEKNKLEKKLIQYYSVLALVIFIITITFILLYITYQTKEEQRKELIKSKNNLRSLNYSLQDKVLIEIEKNKEKENQNFQDSKLIQMGEMISMIAHQWRQPLNAISAASINISLLSNIGKLEPEKAEQSSEFIQEQCQKMSATIDTFLNFVKPSKESKVFLLSNAVKTVMQIMGAQLANKDIKVNIDIKESDISTNGHEDLLEQVIINLISNSRDAFEELKLKNKFIKITIFLQDETIPTVSVKDNAGGIPKEISEKIFNPYFTTKEQDKGTGIGLYMSRDIMKKSFNGNLVYHPTKDGSYFKAQCEERKNE